MSTIRRLPDDLANQIAAGEVVERPASVVKELVENAIDAQASRIRVDIEGGGIGLVRVTDDGIGMNEADARLCIERHATSKIRSLEDLERIGSLGFRGEALASIASVSRFCLRTRRRDTDEGVEVRLEGGQGLVVEPCGTAAGTTIEVRDLFFNVPARRKFLRSAATESARVTEVVEAAALAFPELTFQLARDKRVVREWLRASSREERVRGAYKDEPLATCLGERGPCRVEAYLSRPERARAGTNYLTLLVNGRPVRDRAILRAVGQAYGSVLEPGRSPFGVVYLDLDPTRVDVNVHPQKAEVRFADGRAVADAVFRILADQLAQAFGLAVTSRPLWPRPNPQPAPSPAIEAIPWNLPAKDEPDPWQLVSPQGVAEPVGTSSPPPKPEPPTQPYPILGGTPVTEAKSSFRHLRFVAQVRQTYLICEGQDGIYILDQHAAAERVTFHRLRKAYAGRDVATQRLLFPVTVEVTAADVALVEDEQPRLAQFGIDLRAIGPTTVAVSAVPKILSRVAPEDLVRDLLAEVGRTGGRAFSNAIDLVLATMACHGSIRAGDRISPDEATALLTALDEVDFAGHCPHGRPVVTRVSWDELERKVGRR